METRHILSVIRLFLLTQNSSAFFGRPAYACWLHILNQLFEFGRCPLWVNRVVPALGRRLPVYPGNRTLSAAAGMCQKCQRTKSLRSSPLRGGKSREVGSQSRGQRWSNGELVLRMEMSANVTQDRAPYEQRYTTLSVRWVTA